MIKKSSSNYNKASLNDKLLNRYRPLLSFDPVDYRDAISDLPDLLERQRDAHTAFLQADVSHAERADRGLHAMLSAAFPVKGKNTNGVYVLEYDSYEVRNYICTIQHAHRNHMTYARPLYVKFRLSTWDLAETTCHSIVEENICLGNVPCPTGKGTFVINGVERVIVSQAHRSSGMFFDQSKGKTEDYRAFVGRIVPHKGAWIDLESDSKNLLYIRVDRKKVLATSLLMALDDQETWEKRQNQTLDPRAARGFSKQEILAQVYNTFEAHKQSDGHWKIATTPELWENHVLRHDLLNASGELVAATGTRPNVNALPAELLVPHIALHSLFLARDLVKPNGVVVAEAGAHITDEILDAHNHLRLVATRDGHPTAALCTTIAAEKCITRWDAISEVTKALRPGENLLPQVAENYIADLFFNPNRYDLSEIGRAKVNERTGATYTDRTLRSDDFFAMIKTLLKIRNGLEDFDDIDSLRNRRIRGVDELLEAHCRQSIVKLAMSARDRIAAAAPSESDGLMPSTVLLTKPIVIAFREFFSSSQLSQLGDACNPLSEVAHGNRLSAMGPGGLTREYASFEVRDVHASHYGRICPIETPEGASVGLINSRAIYANINKHGFMETRYRVIINGTPTEEVVSLTYSAERDKIIAPFAFVKPGERIPGTTIACRYNGDIVKVPPEQVQLMDISPFQSISISASLIPFVSHNDPSRALMGANMQRQALPLIYTEAPYVCTGSELSVAIDSGAVIRARNAGTIVCFDHAMIIIQPNDPLKPNDRYDLVRFVKSNAGTFIHHRPLKALSIGDQVEAGQIIADCAASEMGEIALGKNVLVAFTSWYGYNFEDAVVVSKRLVDEDIYTSIHISQHDAIAHDTKSGEELFTRDLPNVAPELLAKLDDNGIIGIGAEVKHGDILVGKVTPKIETHAIPEEKLLRSIFGDKAADVYDLSLRVPAGVHGVVTDVQIISRRGYMTEEEIVAVTNREREQVLRAQTIELELWHKVVPSRLDQNSILSFTSPADADLVKQINLAFTKYCKTHEIDLPTLTTESVNSLLDWASLLTLPPALILQLPINDAAGRLEYLRSELQALKVTYEKQLQELTSAYKAGSEELPPGVMRSVRVFITSKRRIQAGDKVAGRHGNKCVVSVVVAEEDMPYMEDGTPIDILLSPLGVPSRLNLGQILELVSGMVARSLRKQLGTAIDAGNLKEVRRLLSKAQDRDLTNASDEVVLNIARQIADRGVGVLAIPFCSPKAERITEYVEFLGLPSTCKFKLHDGRTGDQMLHPVAVGSMYIMRLNHDVDDKEHARSVGPYALINQQPLGGKAQFGGQRVGEMEVWALQAAGAAYTLLEILTVKSDDIQGRLQAYDAFVRGDDRFTVNTPESFKIFCLYARALCLNIRYKDTQAADFIQGISDYSISTRLSDIDLRFSIASPDEILDWSYGEVESTETNYHRTDRPVASGLFCARIFGPVNNYHCNCGKYKRMKYNGIVCEKCEVEVTHSRVRRERMGHIVLATPLTHIWFTHVLPSRIGTLLDLNLRTIENILSCEAYVVINPGSTEYAYGHIISSKEYDKIQETIDLNEADSHANFTAETGGEAIATMLKMIDLEEESKILKQELRIASSEAKRKKVLKKLELVQQLISSGTRPEWMTITILGVLPPGLRPLLMIDAGYGRSGSIGVNDLYKTILNRNNRLKTFLRINAPLEIVRNERRALQQAVDTLFDNGRSGSTVTDNSGRKYRSLSSFIKGKQGICRQDLLGKRVDYSGRSVIVVGPELRLDQCGLPRRMALELFKPQVMAKLESYGFTSTLRAARRLIEQEAPEVWDILAEVIKTRPVLLNRAPTLHRLGIQAFNPVLIEGKAIRLHPLVCAAFNADFDGDQMSVHTPLSVEARLEAHFIMLSTKNLLSPASGLAVIAPSQDIVLGIYELTHTYDTAPQIDHLFASFAEVTRAVDLNQLHLQAKIQVCINGQIVDTTPGRVIFYSIFPRDVVFDTVNKVFRKKDIGRVLYQIHKSHGPEVMARFADAIKDLGFYWATRSGLTVGKDDFITIPSATQHIERAELVVREYKTQYTDGLLTQTELISKSIDTWTKCTENVVVDMMRDISRCNQEGLNPLFKMIDSGARGSPGQLRQMIGIRGLIARADNSIMNEPVLENYKDGLNSLNLFNSNFGARKGATDTALKTSNAGHLTRKLVEACQCCVITELDCGTAHGIKFVLHIDEQGMRTNMYELGLGRMLCNDLLNLKTGEILLPRGTLVTAEHAQVFEHNIINQIVLRSAIKCRSKTGICAHCYGTDLSKDRLVSLGEAVGVIAAQSIGEPGAQLTMNTFHAGGVAQVTSSQSSITLQVAGVVRFFGKVITNAAGEHIVFTRTAEIAVYTEDSEIELSRHRVPYASTLLVQDGQKITPGTLAANWDPYSNPIITEQAGTVRLHDVIEGISLVKETDDLTGAVSYTISDWKQHSVPPSFQPKIEILDADSKLSFGFTLTPGASLEVQDSETVAAAAVLARTPKGSVVSKDITGGLRRVSELLEARQNPKLQATLSEIDGYVEYDGESRGRYKFIVKSAPDNNGNQEKREYLIPQYRTPIIQTGDFVRKGDPLTDGVLSAHCILRVLGIDALVTYMISEVQNVYQRQGASINNKHLEIVLRQMLQKREVVNSGDSTILTGNYIDNVDYDTLNNELIAAGKQPIIAHPILMGITNSAIHGRSALSSVSFQNSIRTFIKESIAGTVSRVTSPKDYVIVAALMDAGTGFVLRNWLGKLREIQKQTDDASDTSTMCDSDAESCVSEAESCDSREGVAAPL